MAVGRISGPLLKANLLREGVDLAFETDLLYLSVADANNQRIGINTTTPQYDLDVNGTTRSTNIFVSNQADIGNLTISGNTVSSSTGTLNLGTNDSVVYQQKAVIDDIEIEGNVIRTNVSNSNLEFKPNGTGTVEIFADTNVYGDIVATGSITADGDITIGDADTDNVVINAEIASDIIPDQDDTFALGSVTNRWADVWVQDFYAGIVTTNQLEVDGVDLALRQGNIWYVAENGSDTYTGDHPSDPYGSIKYAVENASAGETVHIYPGTYTENFPITVPVGVTIKGHGIRSVKIQPTSGTRYNDAFLLNGESSITDLTVTGFYSGGNYFEVTASSAGSLTVNVGIAPFAHTYVSGGTVDIAGTDYNVTGATYDHTTGELVVTHTGGTATVTTLVFLSNLTFSCNSDTRIFPDNGYAFRFATDFEVSTRSPYIKNITVITQGSTVDAVLDPRGFDAGDAGKGAYVDGAYATANSREASMLFHSVTFITPGVTALTMTNGARVEWLNSFTYFADKSLYAFDSNEGLRSAGKTALRVESSVGTYTAGETVTYYDLDGTTVLASGTISSVEADGKFYIDGKSLGFVTPVTRGGKVLTASGDAQLNTSVKKYGSSSLSLDGTGDSVNIQTTTDFGFGTGDFSVELWYYPTTTGDSRCLLDFRAGTNPDSAAFIGINISNRPYFLINNVAEIVATSSVTQNSWNHLALVRSSGTTILYVNGIGEGTYTDSNNYGTAKPLVIGNTYGSTAGFTGYIDEVRVIKGVAEYTGDFGVPNQQLSVTSETVLMARFNGTNGDTTFEDDVIYTQDIRFSGGATANSFSLVDYTDFGGELRSIASASVYGNYGAYGDGPGVLMYLISQNFAYIGTGKEVTNDATSTNQENEVTELNDAKIRYSSVDHQGDFRVGDLFYVDQQTGTVNFTSSDLNIETSTGISITTGGNTTTITGDSIDTGNIKISGNTIETISGDLIFDSATETIRLDVTGAFNIPTGTTLERPASPSVGMIRYNTDNNLFEGYDGNWTALNGLYDLDLDTYITAELTPGANDNIIRFYTNNNLIADLDANRFNTDRLEVDDISIDSNIITTTTVDTDLIIDANGTGSVVVDNFAFKDNVITNTVTDSITILRNTGTGYVKVEGTGGIVIPTGEDAERPGFGARETGMIRYNSEQQYLEVFDGVQWTSVAGSAGGISASQAEDIALEYVLVLG